MNELLFSQVGGYRKTPKRGQSRELSKGKVKAKHTKLSGFQIGGLILTAPLQLIQQRLRLQQIGRFEPFRETVVTLP
jgi:hypothetical protein